MESVNGSIDVASVTASPKRGRGRPRKDRGASGAGAVKTVLEDGEEDKENYQNGILGREFGGQRESEARSIEVDMPTEMPTQMVVQGGKKGSVKRPHRGDGATVLTQNARYTVKLLPSTPKELRREGVEYRGCLGAGHHALAVTRERTWIWDYTSHAPVNNARTFDVPFPVRKDEPLPFGALVSHGGSMEMSMVLVHATTGKIVFYDSIERAASLGLFQKRNTSVEGSIPGLFSGETITSLVSADHAGFILSLTSGRIVQLTLRDAQGKARIFTQFLRATEQGSGGFFGSIKGFLGSSAWKRDVAAVHTRPLGTRGQMQVLSLTERAELQVWDLDWSGQCTFKSTVDFREMVVNEAKNNAPVEMHGVAENLTMLDFAIVDSTGGNGHEVATLGTEQPIELLVLLKMGGDDRCSYMLAEVNVAGQTTQLGRLLDLMTYHKAADNAKKPKLLLPKPQHTAIVAFEDALVVTSIGQQEGDSPEAQLHASYIQALTFEDAICLRQGRDFAFLGASDEDTRGSRASSIAFVQGAGLVRLTAVDPEKAEQMSRLPVKSKMEQAVFYGSLQENNILDFGNRGEIEYSPDDIEGAALTTSDEILRSTSSFISTNPTSIESQLAYKARALRALIHHVRQTYPTLSKAVMWQLLWDAERVAAAQVLWKTFEEHVAASSKKKRTSTVMDEVCGTLQSQHHRNDADARNSDDVVTGFFVHKLHHLERVFVIAKDIMKTIGEEDQASETKLRLVLEANDIWNKGLEAVFAFRADNAASYGILPEFIEDGVLSDSAEYHELPEFWTSTVNMLKAVDEMCKLSRTFADDEWERVNDPNQEDLLRPVVEKICGENPGLIQILCNIYQERIHWLASRPSDKDRQFAEKLRRNYDAAREDEFRALAGVAQTEAGLRLAEKYRDMHTLTLMIVGEMQFCMSTLDGAPDEERRAVLLRLNEMTQRIGKYFQRFGDDWANAYFDEGFSGSNAGMMLRDAQENWQEALSRYLRADPSRAKICWIDDVTASRDFEHAGRCLLKAGREQEGKLWNKKVELSMAKLAMLATQEEYAAEGAAIAEADFNTALPTSDLTVVEIQERLYRNILPEILHCIDRQAELEVAMQKFVIKNQDLHALRSLLETCIFRLLDHDALDPVDLIDVLTLIDSDAAADAGLEDDALDSSEFYLALRVLNAIAPNLKQDQFETTLQLIWKRAYVHDAEIWNNINGPYASQRNSDETGALLSQTALWRTLDLALENNLFDHPDSAVRFLRPSECLGAGCRAEELSWRWAEPDLLDPILADQRTQDEQVQDLIASQRLEEWVEACAEGVRAAVTARAEEQAIERAGEREFAATFSEMEEEVEEGKGMNGFAVGNGYGEGEGSEVEEDVEESAEFDYEHGEDESGVGDADYEDGDGDVEMG